VSERGANEKAAVEILMLYPLVRGTLKHRLPQLAAYHGYGRTGRTDWRGGVEMGQQLSTPVESAVKICVGDWSGNVKKKSPRPEETLSD